MSPPVRLLASALLLAALAWRPAGAASSPRLASLAPNLTELAFAAGAGDLLVATVEFSDYPPAARRIARVGDAFRVDFERLLAARPDVVLTWTSGTPASVLQRLDALGLRHRAIDIRRLEDVPAALREVGRLAGRGHAAELAAREFEQGLERRRRAYAGRSTLSVFVQLDDRPLYTVNGAHVISEIVELCGGRNVFAGLGQLAPPVALEAVLAADPQVILNTDETIADVAAPWRAWPQLAAVRSDAIRTLPADLVARPSPRLLEGVDATCRVLDELRRAPR